jgi:hypothetical protein
MPNRRTERVVRDWLSRLIPIPLDNLLEEERICTICLEPFPAFDEDGDYPVRVNSTWPDSTCQHVFGRLCIEWHISINVRYSTRCPICRERWFARPAEDTSVVNLDIPQEIADETRHNDGRTEERNAATRAILEETEAWRRHAEDGIQKTR